MQVPGGGRKGFGFFWCDFSSLFSWLCHCQSTCRLLHLFQVALPLPVQILIFFLPFNFKFAHFTIKSSISFSFVSCVVLVTRDGHFLKLGGDVGHGHALCADSLSTPSLSLIRLDYYYSLPHIISPYSLLPCTIISSCSFYISFTISLMPMPLSHAYSIWILAMHLLYYYSDIDYHLCTSTPPNTLDFYYLYLVSSIVPGFLGPLGTLVLGRIDTILQY